MAEPTKAIGLKITWTGQAPTLGQMDDVTLDSIAKTASMALELTPGLMAVNTKGSG
jgi:hypothetical protein